MTHNDIKTLFAKMRELLIPTETQRSYDARQWRECMDLWFGIFNADSFACVWAAVRRYIRDGGKFWPYPGEIADRLPCDGWASDEALKTLSYTTVAQERANSARSDKNRILHPWR